MKNPRYNAIIVLCLIFLIFLIGYFLYKNISNRPFNPASVFTQTNKIQVQTRLAVDVLNSQASQLATDSGRIALAQALGANYYYSFSPDYSSTLVSSDEAALATFAQTTGLRVDVMFDMPHMLDSQIASVMNLLHPEFIALGQETQSGLNKIDAATYTSLANHFISQIGTQAKVILDGSSVFQTTPDAVSRRNAVAAITATPMPLVRQYAQIGNIITFNNGTQDNDVGNANALNNYFTNPTSGVQSLPAFLNLFRTYYPSKKEAVLQVSTGGSSGGDPIGPTNLGTSAIGRNVEFVLRNTADISYWAWESAGPLLAHDGYNNPTNTAYPTLKMLAPLFKNYQYVQDYQTGISGVTGLLFSNPDGTSALLLNNINPAPSTITPGNNFGTFIHTTDGHNFSRTTRWATTWLAPSVGETVSENNIFVQPDSVSVVTFRVSTDTTPPVITINGGNSMSVTQGSSFTNPSATVTDNVDTNLTATITGTVNTSVVGSYTLTYSATDSSGNTGTASLVVTVTSSGGGGTVETGGLVTNSCINTSHVDHFEILSTGMEQLIGSDSYVYHLPTTYANTSDPSASILAANIGYADLLLQNVVLPDPNNPNHKYIKGPIVQASNTSITNTFVYVDLDQLGGAANTTALTAAENWMHDVVAPMVYPLPLLVTTEHANAIYVIAADACKVSKDTTAPTVSNVAATPSSSSTGATFTWMTNEIASSSVIYGPTTNYGTTTAVTDNNINNGQPWLTSHSVTIYGLTPNTTYHYKIKSCDPSTYCYTTIDHTFTTNSSGAGGGGGSDTTAPSVSMSAPSSGATISNTASLSATATDNVGIDHVDFYRASTLIGGTTTHNGSSYSLSWDTTSVGNGSYTLTAHAYDAAGNSTISNGTAVSVNNTIIVADTIHPTVSLTAPASGTTVSGASVTVSATATDNVGVTKVEFYRGSTLIDLDTTASGTTYAVTWDTTGVANGSYQITAKAYDAAGNTTTSSANTVTVSNTSGDTIHPTVSITSPASDATIIGAIGIAATASDNVGVAGVQFKLDGANLGAEDTTSPYMYSWNAGGVSNGAHTLTAVARDAAGNTTTSASVSVTVSNVDNINPVVSITTPASGAELPQNGSVPITATASDDGGVSSIAIYFDGDLKKTCTNVTTCTYILAVSQVSNHDHLIKAMATDTSNNNAIVSEIVTKNN